MLSVYSDMSGGIDHSERLRDDGSRSAEEDSEAGDSTADFFVDDEEERAPTFNSHVPNILAIDDVLLSSDHETKDPGQGDYARPQDENENATRGVRGSSIVISLFWQY